MELKAIILGIIQGLTEFLPVSSSGHLEIGKVLLRPWFGDSLDAEESMMMTVVLHAATALSTVVVFRAEIFKIVGGLFEFELNEDSKFVSRIVLTMIPAAIIGVLYDDQIELLFTGELLLVGTMLLATGAMLFLADRSGKTDEPVGSFEAVIIGISQAIAILPGISRSGATISTSVLLGIDREQAARFSFLMVVPLIMGKMAKDLISGDFTAVGTPVVPLLFGFAAAFLTGILACKWMIALVKNCQLWWFSLYCFIVGGIAIGCSLMGYVPAGPATR